MIRPSFLVMLSAGAEALSVAKGKHLAPQRARPFAALRVTLGGNFS